MPQAPADKPQKTEDLRRHRRYHSRITGRLIAAGADVPCTIVDVSASGAQLSADVKLSEGDTVALSIPGIGFMRGAVRRLEGGNIAIAFETGDAQTMRLLKRISSYFATASQSSKS